MDNNLCVNCNENEAIDGFRCFGCKIDYDYAEGIEYALTLDWKE